MLGSDSATPQLTQIGPKTLYTQDFFIFVHIWGIQIWLYAFYTKIQVFVTQVKF